MVVSVHSVVGVHISITQIAVLFQGKHLVLRDASASKGVIKDLVVGLRSALAVDVRRTMHVVFAGISELRCVLTVLGRQLALV